jgi:hypothetical protein
MGTPVDANSTASSTPPATLSADAAPIGPNATWVMVLGSVFGAITLLGLFGFAFLAGFNREFICNSFTLLAAVFSLGIGLSAAFIGGAAIASGQFGEAAKNNSLKFSAGGGIAAVFIAFWIFQYFQPTNCAVQKFAHSLLTYPLPQPPEAGDFLIKFGGRSDSGQAGFEPLIYVLEGDTQKSLLYLPELQSLRIIIRNRALFKHCNEDDQDAKLLSRDKRYSTTYNVIFSEGRIFSEHRQCASSNRFRIRADRRQANAV